jgi:hypothetical protein
VVETLNGTVEIEELDAVEVTALSVRREPDYAASADP